MAEFRQDRPGATRHDDADVPAVDEGSFRRGVCAFCCRETAVAAVATVHQATGCGWSIRACRTCIDDDGATGRRVRLLRVEDAAQARLLQEIHDRHLAEVDERHRGG